MVSATIAKIVPFNVAFPIPLITLHTISQLNEVGFTSISPCPARLTNEPIHAAFRFPIFLVSGAKIGINIIAGIVMTDIR